MPPPLIGGGIKRWCCLTSLWRLTSVSLSRTSGIRREQGILGRLKLAQWVGTELAHVTRDSDTTFKVKGQGHQAALFTAVLTRQAAAAVGVGTYWPWETTATVRSARRREALWRPQREERGWAYRGGRLPTACWGRLTTLYLNYCFQGVLFVGLVVSTCQVIG